MPKKVCAECGKTIDSRKQYINNLFGTEFWHPECYKAWKEKNVLVNHEQKG